MKKNPKVSILCITYNQEKYIRQALESFVSQKTNFDFEILVHDDASTDGTQFIIEEFVNKYPEKIRTFFQKENQYSKGIRGIMMKFLLPHANGKYLALCEGDDFFTDENKLQIQSDFLDENPEYSMCFHPVRIFFENKEANDYVYPDISEQISFTKENLLKKNFIQTNSVMYRKQCYADLPKENIIPSDWYLHLYHAQFGKIGFINTIMAAYRRHLGGIWWESDKDVDSLHLKHGIQELNFLNSVYRMFTNNSSEYLRKVLMPFAWGIMNLFLANKKYDELEECLKLYSEYQWQMSDEIKNKNQEIQRLRNEIIQKQAQLSSIVNPLKWKIPNYFYKKYKIIFGKIGVKNNKLNKDIKK